MAGRLPTIKAHQWSHQTTMYPLHKCPREKDEHDMLSLEIDTWSMVSIMSELGCTCPVAPRTQNEN